MGSINAFGTSWQADGHGGVPARFRKIKQRVSARDRAWFAAHPGEDRYVRPYVPGELWPDLPPPDIDVVVLVTQVMPGFRSRRPFAHVVKHPSARMAMLDPSTGRVLPDVPMEGFGA